jgi:hypothetical protein
MESAPNLALGIEVKTPQLILKVPGIENSDCLIRQEIMQKQA